MHSVCTNDSVSKPPHRSTRKWVLRLKEARPCPDGRRRKVSPRHLRRWQLLVKWNRSNVPTTTVPPGATVARAMASLAVRRDMATLDTFERVRTPQHQKFELKKSRDPRTNIYKLFVLLVQKSCTADAAPLSLEAGPPHPIFGAGAQECLA